MMEVKKIKKQYKITSKTKPTNPNKALQLDGEWMTLDPAPAKYFDRFNTNDVVDAEVVDRNGKMFITFVSKTGVSSKPIGKGNSYVPNKFVDNSAGQAFGLACNLALRKALKSDVSEDGWWDLYSSYVGLFYNKNKELKEKIVK